MDLPVPPWEDGGGGEVKVPLCVCVWFCLGSVVKAQALPHLWEVLSQK